MKYFLPFIVYLFAQVPILPHYNQEGKIASLVKNPGFYDEKGELIVDERLQACLNQNLDTWNFSPEVLKQISLAFIDLSTQEPKFSHYQSMIPFYGASITKMGSVIAAFQLKHNLAYFPGTLDEFQKTFRQSKLSDKFVMKADGEVSWTDSYLKSMNESIRVSHNGQASNVINALGFEFINSALHQSELYNVGRGGGFWVGKAYGGGGVWMRNPLDNSSHGATALAVAHALSLLSQNRLVSPEASLEIREIFNRPGLNSKFVKALLELKIKPENIYRKSGTWEAWTHDGVLVEEDDKKYVLVALTNHRKIPKKFHEELILQLRQCL